MQKSEKKQPDHVHRNLTGEHQLGHIGQLTIAVVFALVWLLDTFVFKSTVFLNDYIPNIIRTIIGIACSILSGYLVKSSHNTIFGESRETAGIIQKGPYKIIRHPMYLSEILLYLGLLFFSISIAAAFVWILAVGFFYYICRYEEQLLLQRFGEDYRKYVAEVPMWIPRVGRR